ncbi:metallo-beta-lactamase superfamily [Fusarium albosuccineum]|uniref:Metallo-beta-lactamase superfamily n=1 Tax=Fusarium albosuccineum TaxID=1237068 RepID=A0A8H4PFA5_9HYPO|nr:metallo-beta-lactamase superfamily [Fusarium albosuccineum]
MVINIRIIETGNIKVRPSQMSQPPGSVLLRRLKFLSDRKWTDPIPIYAFLITHPEGNFLFDLGETPKCVEPGYYPCDHAGGLPDVYCKTDIFVSQSHWDAFQKPFFATMEGANPSAWPNGFLPSILQPTGPAIGPWEFSYPITKDGRLLAVDTPGHVPGHVSLIVIDDDVTYFLTGDAAYSLELLDKQMIDGINTDPYVAIESQRKIKEFCSQRPVIVLPSHEYDSIRRLEAKEIYRAS